MQSGRYRAVSEIKIINWFYWIKIKSHYKLLVGKKKNTSFLLVEIWTWFISLSNFNIDWKHKKSHLKKST